MSYQNERGGRVGGEGSEDGRVGDQPVFWTFDMVEARLIETLRSWRRTPGGGRWPFASDGPWHLIRKDWWDWDARDAAELRAGPLLRSEIAAMEEATEWLTWVADEGQRRALVAGLVERARGAKQVGWMALRERLAMPETPAALEWRYSRAVTFMAHVLNALAGFPYRSRRGAAARWPDDVLAVVERVRERGIGACQAG